MAGNRISALPDFLGSLVRLETLSLAGNQLSALPSSLGRLPRLKQLLVGDNRLRSLPQELGDCTSLEELDAHRNALRVGPCKALGGLGEGPDVVHRVQDKERKRQQRCVTSSMLKESQSVFFALVTSHANVPRPTQELPSSLGKLQRLKLLQLDGNQISALPPALLRGCTSLATISLHGNPITPEALQQTDGFAEFEARRQSKYTKTLATGVLLGAGGMDEGLDRPTLRAR